MKDNLAEILPIKISCNMPFPQRTTDTVVIGSRRYVLTSPEVEWMPRCSFPYSSVFVPIEVPEEHRKAWAAGFLEGARQRVHDNDLPRTCDDPPSRIDPQPNLVEPRS